MKKTFKRLFSVAVMLGLVVSAGAAGAEEKLTLAVFAYRPKATMTKQFQPLVDYLNQAVPEAHVTLEPLGQQEMEQELAAGHVDLVFTNPSHFILLRHLNQLTGALATLVSREHGVAVSNLGGVIVTLAERDDIATIRDLRGMTVAVPGTKFLGGYQAQAMELLQRGIRVQQDIRQLEAGGHDGVVQAVLDGRADAGFIRTGMLEWLAAAGTLTPGRLKVVNPQHVPNFPFQLSTRLYPEWPFAALPHVNEQVVRRLTSALLALEPDDPAAKAAGIYGFTIPADYQPVEQLARALRLPPFEQAPDFTLADIVSRYRDALVVLAVTGIVILLLAVQLGLNNRHLRQARIRAEESEEVFRRLYEDSPSPVLIMSEGRFVRCNQAALNLLRAERDYVIARTALDISPPFQGDGQASETVADGIKQVAQQNCSARFDWTLRRPDGGEVVVEVSLTPIALGGHLQAFLSWTDITDRKRGELELRQANQRLAEQAAELLRVNEELEQFASVASHDLRQPLRMVSSFLGLIERQLGEQAVPELRDYLRFAQDGAKRMDRLILDLLDYSRSGRHSTPPAPVRLDDAVAAALNHLQPLIDDTGAQVRVASGLPVLNGHGSDVLRLFQNLIGNALKYRHPDRPPEVEVGCRRDGGHWQVWVKDNGTGIAEADRDRVFKIFQRLVANSECEGTGIGLAVCKKIDEHMGGVIRIESEPDQGSTFLMRFPADA